MNPKILLVEDDLFIRDSLKSIMLLEQYTIIECGTVREAKALVVSERPQLAILDVLLPDGNGFDLCKEIQSIVTLPVLFLTCCDEEINIVRGFESGGSDYVTKPFRVKELLSRVKSLLRRFDTTEIRETLSFMDITMDLQQQNVVCADCNLLLTPNEFKILQLLLRNAGKIITRQIIFERIWDIDGNYIDDNTLSVHISAIRRKLEKSSAYIKTVRGEGYTICRRNEQDAN